MELFLQILVIVLLVLAAFFSWKGYQYSSQVYNGLSAATTAK